jgi:hypothetical protein
VKSPIRLTIVLCAALLLGGCRTSTSATAPAATMVRSELFFGLGRKNAPDISEQEWREFVDQQITPRFPDGLTILDARGQWRGEDGVVQREPSHVLILLHPPGEDADARIEQIRALYRQRFAQDSVLRTDTMQRVSF